MKKMLLSGFVFVFVLSITFFTAWADGQKIAVVSDGNTAASAVSSVAARGSYFLIFDGKGKLIEAINNPHKDAGGGSSHLVVDYLSGKGVTMIIAGTFGNKMIAAMESKLINYLTFKGTAVDAIKKVIQ
jgi:predicted Fe-Mo cluster-binding NifX family protein